MSLPVEAASPSTMPLVQIAPGDARQFQRALAALASQAHVALVAEGTPLKPELSVAEVSRLTTKTHLDQAVSNVAASYDYDAQRRGNVFILTKRYTDTRDLPCVTLEECRQAVDTLSDVLNVFNPNFATSIYASGPDGRRDAVLHFFQSLSSPQLQAAQAKKLYYGSLSPNQQTLIQGLFLYQYVQTPLAEAHEAIGYLDYASKSAIKARNPDGYSGLFMEVPSLYSGTSFALVALTGGLTPLNRPQPSMVRVPPSVSANFVPLKPTTLEKVVAGLKPIDGKLAVVDLSLRDKPVTAIGTDYAGTRDVLNALSALYGLDLIMAHGERPKLLPHSVDPPASIREIDAAVWASLPVSYARALHIVPADPSLAVNLRAPLSITDFQNQTRSMQLLPDFQKEANDRLLLAIQPYLKKQGLNARISVKSLDDDAQAALAVSLMTSLVANLQVGFSGFPHQSVLNCMDNKDQIVVYTVNGEDAHINNQDIPSIYLEGTDPYTQQKVGLGGVRYFSHN